MDGCYLMNDVQVENGCTLTDCMLDDGVVVKMNTSISGGSILAKGVSLVSELKLFNDIEILQLLLLLL